MEKIKKNVGVLILLVISIILILGGLLFWILNAKNKYPTITITPQAQDELGVAPDTSFDVLSSCALKKDELDKLLTVEPAFDLAFDGDGKNWTLAPSTPLAENTVYTFTVANPTKQSFTFQTKGDLAVSSAYPATGSTYVGLDTAIEFTLNAPDVDVKASFQILPETKGTLTTKGYTTTFVPSEPLLPGAIYRISLKSGLTAKNKMTLKNNYEFSFTTTPEQSSSKMQEYPKLSGNYSETFLPGDLLAVELLGDENINGINFNISVNKFPSIAEYESEIRARDIYYNTRYGILKEYSADTSKLESVLSFKSELLQKENNNWAPRYAILPSDLPSGFYIVTISSKDKNNRDVSLQKQIQICDKSLYVQSSDGDTLVWLNNPATGKPTPNAMVIVEDPESGKSYQAITDAEGIAKITTEALSYSYLKLEENNLTTYFEPVNLNANSKQTRQEQFYTAIYTDREIYQPNDTIRFWGTLFPRSSEFAIPKFITATLGQAWQDNTIYSKKIAVNPDGTFTGEIKTTGLKKDSYKISITDGTKRKQEVDSYRAIIDLDTYVSKNFSVTEYTKPPYVITTTNNKNWYYSNEPIDFQISAAYFDGIPLANGKLSINSYSLADIRENPAILILDSKGKTSYSGTYKTDAPNGDYLPNWAPTSVYTSINSGNLEDVYIETSTETVVATSKIACKLEGDEPSDIKISTAQIDPAKLDAYYSKTEAELSKLNEPSKLSFYDKIKGAPVDIPLDLVVSCNEIVRTENGSYYDPINKKTIQKYKYDYKNYVADTIKTKTIGGTVTLSNLAYKNDDFHRYTFTAQFDSQINGKVSESLYFYPFPNEFDNNLTTYSFEKFDPSYNKKSSLKIGDPVSLELFANNEKVPNKGRVLYTAINQKNIETGVFSDQKKAISFNENYIPNTSVSGAYFDGRHVFKITPMSLDFDYTQRTLKVEVSADKKAYAPGDKALVTIKLTDPSGKPTAGSACIGVVDEAVFALAPQELDIPSQLYQKIYTTISANASYTEYDMSRPNPETGGMGGGGPNGTPIREEFVDTALFKTITVDETGTATIELNLPDNTTSWRITAAAVSSNLCGGNATSNTIATLPFQIRAIYTDTYLEGDDISIAITPITAGEGTLAAPALDAKINYTAQLLSADNKIISEQKVSGQIGTSSTLSFGKQKIGQYKLNVTATCGEFSDALSQPLSIAKEGPMISLIKTGSLDEISETKSLKYPVHITVYDNSLKTPMKALEIINSSFGDRTEILAASYKAGTVFNDLLASDITNPIRKDARLEDIQSLEGGVKFLPLSEPSAETTAKILIATPDLIDVKSAVEYLKTELARENANINDRVMAYAGLAAAKEPVLADVRQILSGTVSLGEPLTATQKLYLGAGLAKAGDIDSANTVYDSLLELKKPKDSLIYLDLGDEISNFNATSAALMLTSLSRHEDAEGLAKYIIADYSLPKEGRETMANLELLTYAQKAESFKTASGKKAKFSANFNGKPETIELNNTGIYSFSLSSEDLTAGSLKAMSGDLSASIRYTDYAPANSKEQSDISNNIKIKKSITPIGSDALALNGRAKVELKVTFSENAKAGCYQISDMIPSNMRYLNSTDYRINQGNSRIWSVSEQEGQRVYASLFFNPNEKDNGSNDEGIIPHVDSVPAMLAKENSSASSAPASSSESLDPNKNEYIFIYYVNIVLPGDYVTEALQPIVHTAEENLR